jgi:hypothetical protein
MEVVSDPTSAGHDFLDTAVHDEHLDWSSVALNANVASGIEATAREKEAMVCMATRGHGRSVALIGSIPEDVVRHATTPVALVGPGVDI